MKLPVKTAPRYTYKLLTYFVFGFIISWYMDMEQKGCYIDELSWLAALEIVQMTISDATNDEKLVTVTS